MESWEDSSGYNCEDYKNHRWCENGVVITDGDIGGLGSDWNFPEANCCVCGKGLQGEKSITINKFRS